MKSNPRYNAPASSPSLFFQQANPCEHPIVILRDVSSKDLESLLKFMYHGEVRVRQKQLSAFLKTAEVLQIGGLTEVNRGNAPSAISSSTRSAAYKTHHSISAPVFKFAFFRLFFA